MDCASFGSRLTGLWFIMAWLASTANAVPGAAWSIESNQVRAYLGASVGSAGDVNGDGYDDVLVGAPFYDGGQVEEGAAVVFHGSAVGLAPAPAWTVEAGRAYSYLGSSVSSAGDVNGDGYDDVIVGAPEYDSAWQIGGIALVFHGSASGLAAAPAWVADGHQLFGSFGDAVAGAGDVNGDGYDDVIVGAYTFRAGQDREGAAFVFHGSATGLSPVWAWMAEGNQVDSTFGAAVAGAGDVNGDGFDDVIVGAPDYDAGSFNEGAAALYLGSAAGLAPTPAWTAEGNQLQAGFGTSVASAGDVNADGYADVVVGAPFYDSPAVFSDGRAFLYLGSAAGLGAAPAWTVSSLLAGAQFGAAVSSAGDVDGDGFDDIAIGTPRFSSPQVWEGAASIFLGGPAGPAPYPFHTIEGARAEAGFGSALAGAGDVDGDGFGDLIVGAPEYRNGQEDEGGAFVFLGL